MISMYAIPLYAVGLLVLVYVVTRVAAAAYFQEKRIFHDSFIRSMDMERNEYS